MYTATVQVACAESSLLYYGSCRAHIGRYERLEGLPMHILAFQVVTVEPGGFTDKQDEKVRLLMVRAVTQTPWPGHILPRASSRPLAHVSIFETHSKLSSRVFACVTVPTNSRCCNTPGADVTTCLLVSVSPHLLTCRTYPHRTSFPPPRDFGEHRREIISAELGLLSPTCFRSTPCAQPHTVPHPRPRPPQDFGEHGREFISAELGLLLLQTLAGQGPGGGSGPLEGLFGSPGDKARADKLQQLLRGTVMKVRWEGLGDDPNAQNWRRVFIEVCQGTAGGRGAVACGAGGYGECKKTGSGQRAAARAARHPRGQGACGQPCSSFCAAPPWCAGAGPVHADVQQRFWLQWGVGQ